MLRRLIPSSWRRSLALARKRYELAFTAKSEKLDYFLGVLRAFEGRFPRECPICGHRGYFTTKGMPPRIDALCPGCRSVEKHRLLWLVLQSSEPVKNDARVLHFAPERCFESRFRSRFGRYQTTDFLRGDVDLRLNIENIDLPAASVDVIFCNHVLEHVDDTKALGELHRILAPAGRVFVTIPIIEGWADTFEDPTIKTEDDRELHYGQYDHLRYFGADFRSRAAKAGFALREYTAFGPDVARYSLIRGEKVFVLEKR
jgi:SAM-dependent methyltransferase